MGKRKGRNAMQDANDWGTDYSGYPNYGAMGGGYVPKKGWDTGDAPKVCTDCSFLPKDTKQKILVDYEIWKTLMAICSTVKVEWQALLTGTIDEQGVVHVKGYWIPKQEVSASSVKNLDLIDDVVIVEKGIVAGVHSHGTMACFFSQTDMDDTNMSLIKHHIVVNNQALYKAQSRVELPCGMAKFVDAEVFTVGEPEANIVGLTNISERSFGFITKSEATTSAQPLRCEGHRWCPSCGMCPEEDSGATCICWTKGVRLMLPDFTPENYKLEYGRTWELKENLKNKYNQ